MHWWSVRRAGLRRLILFTVAIAFVAVPSLSSVSAEWGAYGADGWPLAADGTSTNPYPGTVLMAPWVQGLPSGSGVGDADHVDMHRHAHASASVHDDAPAGTAWGATATVDPINQIAGTTIYPYYPILTAEVQRLASDHPDLVRLHSAGTSALGLDIWMLEIADFARIDAGEGKPLDAREVVWLDGGTHSNEYSGVYFVAHWASFLADEYESNETAQWIVENRHTWIMPMVNPDGSNLFGRLNANAVNINRNYPIYWSETEESFPMNNPGPRPASEPETQANIEWFEIVDPDYYASIHCCGNLWLYPYGFEHLDPIDDPMLSRVCEEAFASVRDDCGPIWSTIYPASGSSVDTAYHMTGAVAFGYEMSGRGAVAIWGQPLTVDDVRVQERESWDGMMHAFLNVHRYGGYPVVVGNGLHGDGGVSLTLQNQGLGIIPAGNVSARLADGSMRSVAFGPLEPGANETVRLGEGIPPGEHVVTIDYQKRIRAEPMGVRSLLLEVTDTANSRTLSISGEAAISDGELSIVENTPTFPAVVSVLVLASLVAVAGRRRTP